MTGLYATRSYEAIKGPVRIKDRIRTTLRDAYLSVFDHVTPWPHDCFLRCLYCHFVFDDQVGPFTEVLNTLRQTGEFVDTDRAVAMVAGREPIDGRYFHLSFDDGFRSIIRNAMPILANLGIPAIFFVPSGIIGASWDAAKIYSLETTNNRAVMEIATWDDLKTARDCGIEIGSHTRTHARLSAIVDEDQLVHEIFASKQEIEDQLEVDCNYISWPFGTEKDVGPLALNLIRDAGYRACFSAIRGAVKSNSNDLMRIPRHHFELHWPLSHIASFCKGAKEG